MNVKSVGLLWSVGNDWFPVKAVRIDGEIYFRLENEEEFILAGSGDAFQAKDSQGLDFLLLNEKEK